jgi:hypothetical protein
MNFTLILAVIAVSGVVAYLGDIIGKRLGKKRVSLFKLRPRQTAVLIAVCTGWVITAVTITALALASRSVREALFTLDQLHQQISQAQDEAAGAQGQRDAALADLAQAEASLESTETRLRQADADRDAAERTADAAQTTAAEAEGKVAKTQGDLQRASSQVRRLEKSQGWLEASIKTLTSQGDAAKAERDKLIEAAGRVSFAGTLQFYGYTGVGSDVFVLEPGDELGRAVLAPHTSVEDARAAIDRVVADAKARAEAAGCQPYDNPDDSIDMTSGLYLIFRRAEPKIGPDWKPMTLAERERAYSDYLQFAAREASGMTEAGDRIYVTLNVWEYRVPKRRPVIAEFNMGRVERVLQRDYVLATRPVPKSATKNDVATAMQELLVAARSAAIEKGVIWQRNAVRAFTYDELETVISEVLRLQGNGLGARLSARVDQEECLNIDEPRIRIDVDAITSPGD